MVKRKKHDKDKYYNLARQQGYRARSAFKLIQLNKKYDFLSTAKVCIDLCAAPGGWCQVAAKYMPASSIILGIDLLPIRPIRGVKTFQCDITTVKCRQIIKQEIQNWQADVVLCDGAPNVGAEYTKDAYVQNELALIALKLAVDVLGRGGIFVSKVFRSQDYNALLWVFKQLFKKVSATKPLSSRNESAEIFVVCEHFLAPHSIDPKLFDPKYVFEQVENQEKSITIFHPKYGQQKRHREGYDESLGMTLTNECTVADFIDSSDPIRLLTDTTAIHFRDGDQVYRDHKHTTDEVVQCLQDLKVLGKGDFKLLLKWRLKMVKYKEELLQQTPQDVENAAGASTSGSKNNDHDANKDDETEPPKELSEKEKEALVREELAQLRANLLAKKKREKKKDREKKRKLRVRAALGMNVEGIDVTEAERVFSLSELGLSKGKVDQLENAGVDSSDEEEEDDDHDHAFNGVFSDDDEPLEFEDSDDEYEELLDAQMEKQYDEFLSRRGDNVKTQKAVKRSKVAKRALAGEAVAKDSELYDGDATQYDQMINPEESSDDDSEDESDKLAVDLKFPEKPSAAVARWFSDKKLFGDMEQEQELSARVTGQQVVDSMPKTDKEIRRAKRKATMERKERRQAKKIKMEEEQYEMEFGSTSGGFDIVATGSDDDDAAAEHKAQNAGLDEEEGNGLSEEKKQLIRSGMGNVLKQAARESAIKSGAFEVVAAAADDNDDDDDTASSNGALSVKDPRKYDSDHEEYDEEDRAKTLALAHMMVRPSKAKELLDASYNRFAWNDDAGLPSWFLDDEEKHYRPQLPIPKKLLDQMKDKFMEMASKPLKKVAEARARKKRQQMKKLKVAKKKATDIANLPDMSTREKLKAIDKAMKHAQIKKQNKVYVVSRRGGRSSTAGNQKGKTKGAKVKLVDPRMKKDKRNADIRTKRGKKMKR